MSLSLILEHHHPRLKEKRESLSWVMGHVSLSGAPIIYHITLFSCWTKKDTCLFHFPSQRSLLPIFVGNSCPSVALSYSASFVKDKSLMAKAACSEGTFAKRAFGVLFLIVFQWKELHLTHCSYLNRWSRERKGVGLKRGLLDFSSQGWVWVRPTGDRRKCCYSC